MDEFDKIARSEEMAAMMAGLKQMAATLGAYFRGMLAEGLTREEALSLTVEMQELIFCNRPDEDDD